jgi:large subunit ribosomal protein L4e
MKLDIITKNNEKKGSVDMPSQFNERLRKDVIKRAVEAEQSAKRQLYGASPKAGMRHSTELSKRRHDYRGTYGIGQSRTPRKVTSRSGERMNFVGAFAPQAVGGRRAHPPKATKVLERKINKREMKLAMRSAIAATLSKELASARGHNVPDNYPFIIEDSAEQIAKTKDIRDFLKKIINDDLERASVKKVRPGKGKVRGRKYKKKKSALIVTGDHCPLLNSAKNIPGIDAVNVAGLTAELLAPGSVPGRLTLWTGKAIEKLGKDKLFM